uniref:Uncharacterized protein n=1 Tax=Setaria viridis TaxID=4556 RepID=A0A4U6W674_SETVI|nr:hypothetical protein SEVIR_1G092200v2 [Setaria viridis]
MAEQPSSYSVFMVDAAAVAGGNEPPPSARTLAVLPGAEHGMSFVAAHSKHGTWIVGVGGLGGSTIIYEPSTPAAGTLRGPELSVPKEEPILISHGGKVYAISRRPKVHRRLNLDFPPWFESLSFKKGVACIYHDGCPSWKSLPPPPCFPCSLDPWDFRYPPDISVSSYAAVGSHMLLSLQQEETGTYAFHLVEKTWEKVCDKNLPFVGQAVPIGGSLFAACRSSRWHRRERFPGCSSAQWEGAASVPPGLGPVAKAAKPNTKDLQIILTAFQMDNVDAILTACQTESAKAKDLRGSVQVKQENQIYKFKNGSRFLASSHMGFIAYACGCCTVHVSI